jgi:hypothetical protein
MIVDEEGIGSFKFETRYMFIHFLPRLRIRTRGDTYLRTFLVAGSSTVFGFWICIRIPVL